MLTGVTPKRYGPRHLPTVTWTRLNLHYRPAVDLARLILTSIEADLHAGTIRAPGLVINMNSVFENFVRNATRYSLNLTEHEFPAGHDAPIPLDEVRRLFVEPDLSHWIDGRCRFVGELKYRYNKGAGDASNLYQTLAYAIAAGVPDAILVYADGPTTVTTHYLPNAGVRIHVRHLDLNLPPTDLLHQINSLAHHITTLITRTPTSTTAP